MSAGMRVDLSALASVRDLIDRIGKADLQRLADSLGAEIESQTRRRIQDEKTAPDGTPWAPWSDVHAATRHGGHSLLQGEGDLLDSIQYLLEGTEIHVGSPLVYAGVMQHGADQGEFGRTSRNGPIPWGDIPGRPYLGLSAENEGDLSGIVQDFLREVTLQ